MSFGVLTLATPNDYKKALGLAFSLRVSNPGIPLAIACSPKLRPLVEPYFDIVIDENPKLRGFEHKVHLDRYTPFDETFFFDSDVLVFRSLTEILPEWRGSAYQANGIWAEEPFSTFGLDRKLVLQKLGKPKLVQIDGAGHAFFTKPACTEVFDLAREITADYATWAPGARYADEDVLDIVMTKLGIEPKPYTDFWSRPLCAKKGTIRIDATQGKCEIFATAFNQVQNPVMFHFAVNETPFLHGFQLIKLFKKFGANPSGILPMAAHDWYINNIRWPIGTWVKGFLHRSPKAR